MTDLTQQQLNKLIESKIPMDRAWGSTIGIILIVEQSLHQFGTGTLFRVGEESFLVTAAHVVEESTRLKRNLCLTGPKKNFVGLNGGAYTSSEETFDIALIHLSKETAAGLEGSTFLILNDVSCDTDLSQGVFTLFGFPGVWSGKEPTGLRIKPFQFTSYAYSDDSSNLENFDPKIHFLINGGPKEITDIDANPVSFTKSDGSPMSFPRELSGISGCSVWKIGDLRTVDKDAVRPRPQIVGVQSCVYPTKECIRATKWAAVVGMIHQYFPALRPILEMYRN
jgi:hypothetical protein